MYDFRDKEIKKQLREQGIDAFPLSQVTMNLDNPFWVEKFWEFTMLVKPVAYDHLAKGLLPVIPPFYSQYSWPTFYHLKLFGDIGMELLKKKQLNGENVLSTTNSNDFNLLKPFFIEEQNKAKQLILELKENPKNFPVIAPFKSNQNILLGVGNRKSLIAYPQGSEATVSPFFDFYVRFHKHFSNMGEKLGNSIGQCAICGGFFMAYQKINEKTNHVCSKECRSKKSTKYIQNARSERGLYK